MSSAPPPGESSSHTQDSSELPQPDNKAYNSRSRPSLYLRGSSPVVVAGPWGRITEQLLGGSAGRGGGRRLGGRCGGWGTVRSRDPPIPDGLWQHRLRRKGGLRVAQIRAPHLAIASAIERPWLQKSRIAVANPDDSGRCSSEGRCPFVTR